MTRGDPGSGRTEARVARDVMTFGAEVGRVLSDGRMVGRAEPFAKVFASSRAVKRAVGLAAWVVLEDIALDARIDDRGRLVAETNVRQIADNLGINKETVSRHLVQLRSFGLVLQEEVRDAASGRYRSYRYVIDPAACIERFTQTPTRSAPRTENPDRAPCPEEPDTVPTGHGEAGQQQQEDVAKEEQQQALERLGVARRVAADLVASHPPEHVAEAVTAASSGGVRNPAAWVVRALHEDWDFAGRLVRTRAEGGRVHPELAAEQAEACERERAGQWARAVSASLDDGALVEALAAVTRPIPGLGRLPAPLARAQLLAWAIAVAAGQPQRPLPESLRLALADGAAPAAPFEGLPPPPPACPRTEGADLTARIGVLLARPA